ncbi:MAG: tetratricopeptide repeat protein [Ferrovibrio sp.]|uniref:tetratricopeptide repeat protein n=1 Tax=Ferrovibrio sp. TaxID=1917215 RepID=UPI002623C88D|nr:tetratricopeptide repeat protein [Ferrovibrio sp.]MCW0234824.1 tetratricopeptide repeat protein [Ferrovibrio sp.]
MTDRASRKRFIFRPVRAALLLAASLLPLAACSSNSSMMSGAPSRSGYRLDSPYGNFLAARHARQMNDNTAAANYYMRALREDPESALLTQGAFIALIADGRVNEAVVLTPSLRQMNPSEYLPRMTQASALMLARDYDAVLRLVAEGPSGGIHAAFNPLLQTFAYAGKGEADQAIASLQKLERHPLFSGVYMHLKPILLDILNQPEPTEAAYREAIEGRERAGTRQIDGFARFLERQGRAADARRLLEEQMVFNPDNPVLLTALRRLDSKQPSAPLVGNAVEGMAEAMFASATALGRSDGGDLAELHLQLALFMRPDLDDARMLLGDIYESRERYDQALAMYARVSLNSAYAESAQLRQAWCISELGRTDEAVRILRRMASADSNSPRALLTLADMYRQMEKWPDSAREYTAALARIPRLEQRHWTILFGRGVAYERSKQFDKGEADMLKALELQPDQPLVLNYLGYSWIDMHRNIERATRMIERAVQLRPNDGAIVDSLGWALYRLARYDEAVVQLERAVELKGGDPVITDHLGDAYWRVGRQEEAKFQWRRALGLKPEQELALQVQRKLDQGLDPVAAK